MDQGRVAGFFSNVHNLDKLDGLINDVRDAIMDYQVCMPNCSPLPCLTVALDFIATRSL